jgi:transcriptional antiterminator
MEVYTIKKILNNNVVIGLRDRVEYVLVGKAIGYDSQKGDKLFKDRIESIFVKQEDANDNFDRILQNINKEIVGLSEEIISLCEKELDQKLSKAIHVSLPDHISFAIHRIETGVKIENPFLNELAALYPKSYVLAQKALLMINDRITTKLP